MWKSDKYNKTFSPPISENIPQGSRWLGLTSPLPPIAKCITMLAELLTPANA
jgi:hypothetical protein